MGGGRGSGRGSEGERMSRQFVALISQQGPQREPWVIVQLPDPRAAGKPGLYVLNSDELLEVHRVQSGERSWFVGDSVQEDGGMLLFTPIDLLFVLLPILDAARRQTSESKGLYRSINDIAEDCLPGVPPKDLALLMKMPSALGRIGSVCDVRDCGTGELLYRLDDDKVIALLRKKVDVIVDRFAEFKALNRKVLKYPPAALEDARMKELIHRKLAVRIVEEYLSETWAARLSAPFDFSDVEKLEGLPVAGYLTPDSQAGEQRHGRKANSAIESATKKKMLTTAQHRLAKANIKGMKTMDSFFTKQKENIPS